MIRAILLLLLLLAGCASQYPTRTDFRSKHYTQMPNAEWCAKAKAFDPTWQPEECPK